jgi:hypothetical protein
MVMYGLGNGPVKTFYMTDLITAAVLNLLMLLAGIGLVWLRNWGRILGMWVAGLKIIRLVVIYTIFAVSIGPVMTKATVDMISKMQKVQQRQAARAGQPAAPGILTNQQQLQVAKTLAVMWTGYAVGFVILGSIYPAVALVLLSTEGCRAACQQRTSKSRPEANDPWQAS